MDIFKSWQADTGTMYSSVIAALLQSWQGPSAPQQCVYDTTVGG